MAESHPRDITIRNDAGAINAHVTSSAATIHGHAGIGLLNNHGNSTPKQSGDEPSRDEAEFA